MIAHTADTEKQALHEWQPVEKISFTTPINGQDVVTERVTKLFCGGCGGSQNIAYNDGFKNEAPSEDEA